MCWRNPQVEICLETHLWAEIELWPSVLFGYTRLFLLTFWVLGRLRNSDRQWGKLPRIVGNQNKYRHRVKTTLTYSHTFSPYPTQARTKGQITAILFLIIPWFKFYIDMKLPRRPFVYHESNNEQAKKRKGKNGYRQLEEKGV